MSIVVRTDEEDKIFIETIDCREIRGGNAWILMFLSKVNAKKVILDGANG